MYMADLQNLIDLLLNKDHKKKTYIEEFIKIVNKNMGFSFLDTILKLFEADVEKNI